MSSLLQDLRADKTHNLSRSSDRFAVELSQETRYSGALEADINIQPSLREAALNSMVCHLRSTGGGMYRDGGSGDDGSNGDECAGGAMHLARRSPAEGGDSEIGG
ncbi:hypothetical protein Tco_1475569 [Tanacetum coccineum]